MDLKYMNMILLLLTLFVITTPTCHCQMTSPQNIETFYPTEIPQPSEIPSSPKPQAFAPSQGPSTSPNSSSSSSNSKVVAAVVATAASTLFLSALIFLSVQRCFRTRRRKSVSITNTVQASTSDHRRVVPQVNVFERMEGRNVKGLIVDEDGLDVVYWRKLEGKNNVPNKDFHKEVLNNKEVMDDDDHEGKERERVGAIHETPLLRGKSSSSHMNIFPQESYTIMRIPPPAPPPPIVPESNSPSHPFSSPKSPSNSFSSIPKMISTPTIPDRKSQAPPPPPPTPIPDRKSVAPAPPPPPAPPIPARKILAPPPPPPPPIQARKSPAPPPPPPSKVSGFKSSQKPPPTPIETQNATTNKEGNSSGEVKLKPLHWDKVNTNLDHSMVWDKVYRGSFRVDDDLMEALFGYIPTNQNDNIPKGKGSKSPSREASAPSTNTFLLDPRKSQNIAIVLKSLSVSRKEITEALIDGHGLYIDTIEKLSRVAPTEEEQTLILEYRGDSTKLSQAESFLYHILKAIPSAFKRLNAMLFRLNYDSEIQEIKEFLNTLEMACKELRNQGMFVKLLEAVLKAGNRMNAGTHRGNAQAFNLASLRKLSDVKSIDGKTTLLHFVVEEVIRSEGKRAVLNRNHSLSRSNSSRISENSQNSATSNEEKQREYITLGLPIVGGISSEFSNVKKAAVTDYNSFVGSISALSARIAEIRELVLQCGSDKGGKFVREMNSFLENSEEELKGVREEQTRVMQLVKRTTDYYQGGASKDSAEHPLYLFVIVKDFLGMVDQACIEIARNNQKKKTAKVNLG